MFLQYFGYRYIIGLFVIYLINPSAAWFEYCDQNIVLAPNSSRYINSPNYPGRYPSGSSCRYNIIAPVDYQINIQCQIALDKYGSSCTTEFFYISTDGRTDLSNSEYNCGSGYIQRMSIFNRMTIAYTSSSSTSAGSFSCLATVIKEQQCDCGWSVNTKIVGGVETNINEFPSMAGLAVASTGKLFCGGVIINHWNIVTAAHCLSSRTASSIVIIVGEHNINLANESPYTERYPVAAIRQHEAYQPGGEMNDIGLITTSRVIQWSRGVGPICLPFLYTFADFSGYTGDIVGWGSTSYGGPVSPVLRKASVNILRNSNCQTYVPQLTQSQMCTYGPPKDACQFDSGGPVVLRFSRQFLVGIISFGTACGGDDPGVNTRITSYLQWIERNTPGTEYCRKQ